MHRGHPSTKPYAGSPPPARYPPRANGAERFPAKNPSHPALALVGPEGTR
jgi:hypothetical protein